MRTGKAVGEDIGGGAVKPRVGAFFLEEFRHGVNRRFVADGFPAVAAVEYRNRKAPFALTRNAPVGTLANHGLHAFDAPIGDPAHVIASRAGFLFERVHGAEPLRRGAENDGAFAAPAVGITMGDVLGGEQRAALFHVG